MHRTARFAPQRLAALGRLWGTIQYFHPYLAYRKDIDWDAALVAAVPKVNHARTTDEFAAAVDQMLGSLDDPVTKVLRDKSATSRATGEILPLSQQTTDGVLIVTIRDYAEWVDAVELVKLNAIEFRRLKDSAAGLGFRIVSLSDEALSGTSKSGTFGDIGRVS